MVAWLHLLLFLASQQASAAPVHKVDIHILGAVATVEVWRAVDPTPRSVGNRQAESTVDLSLPAGAVLVDWEIADRGERARLADESEGQVSAGLAAALKLRQLLPSTAPVDEGADFRIHVTPLLEGSKPVLHYRYSAPVGCSEGKQVLRIPDSLEENPIPADVTVTIEPHPDGFPLAEASLAGRPVDIGRNSRRLVTRGLSPARAGWEVAWRYLKTPAGFPGQALVAASALANPERAKRRRQIAMVGSVCLGQSRVSVEPAAAGKEAKLDLPSSVVLLVDRSRSVGQGGLSEERSVARALIEALPPSTQFNAILFGEHATTLFPFPRMATREALDALSNAADPNQLERGTDVSAALSRVRGANQGDVAAATEKQWTVLVTDGSLPPSQTAERMQEALTGRDLARMRVAVLLVRQRGDDDVSSSARATFARLAASFGGLVREVPSGSAADNARAVISAMGKGGDWFNLNLDDNKVSGEMAAGQGASAAFVEDGSLARHARARFSARGVDIRDQMTDRRLDLRVARVAGNWLGPLVAEAGTKHRAWAGATSAVAVAVLPAMPAPKKATDDIVHGRLDETVLRNALSLAFMPRARACYVSRRVATARDAFLRGRVRLELTIERGELVDAVVRQSTLNHPEIEACLRKAAWEVDYPRPEHRDAPTVANLSLVFRPHTPEEAPPDASPLDREIELILGPLTVTADFQDLLDKTPSDKSSKP